MWPPTAACHSRHLCSLMDPRLGPPARCALPVGCRGSRDQSCSAPRDFSTQHSIRHIKGAQETPSLALGSDPVSGGTSTGCAGHLPCGQRPQSYSRSHRPQAREGPSELVHQRRWHGPGPRSLSQLMYPRPVLWQHLARHSDHPQISGESGLLGGENPHVAAGNVGSVASSRRDTCCLVPSAFLHCYSRECQEEKTRGSVSHPVVTRMARGTG